jgi:hypothetical protein
MRAFKDTLWSPGQPLDPQAKVLSNQELSDRLLYLEKSYDRFDVDQIPTSDLTRRLEQVWLPDPNTLFASGTVGYDSLIFTLVYGLVGAAGTKLGTGELDWSVVRNGVGDYTVTFPAFSVKPFIVGTPVASVTGFRVSAVTQSTARFVASADTDFYFIGVGK